MGNVVYWSALLSELRSVELKVNLYLPQPGYPWLGEIDNNPFVMTIPPKSEEDGFRDFLIVSLYGQEEEKIIPFFSKLMGYKPFCKYLYKTNDKASATYEWDKKDPLSRQKELEEDVNVYELQILEEGFHPPLFPEKEVFFQQVTPEMIERLEETFQKNPVSEYRIGYMLPFFKKVMPRIGRIQSLFGLSIIS